MIYLGLGSNLGDRAQFLRRALGLLISRSVIQSPIRVSHVYQSEALVPAGAPDSWQLDFLNLVIEAESSLSPAEILRESKKIERELGRKSAERWAPREIDIDFLWDERGSLDSDDLKLPHPEMGSRSFVVEPLKELGFEITSIDSEQVSGGLAAKKTPLKIFPSELIGVLNVTPDSFSDGGESFSVESAEARFRSLVAQGASVVDIGAESTRPDAKLLSADEEWLRLESIMKLISEIRKKEFPWIKLSLDTRHSKTMILAHELGVDWMNDVSAGSEVSSLNWLKETKNPFVWMHHLTIPADRKIVFREDQDVVQEIKNWICKKKSELERAGINPERCIWDIGIGFGKSPRQSWSLLSRISEFQDENQMILVGHSRKSFLNLIEPQVQQRDLATAFISAELAKKQIDYLRVHDVAATRRILETSLMLNFLSSR